MKKNTIEGKNKTWDCSWTQYTHAYLFSFHPFSQTSPKLPSPVCLVLSDSQLAQLFLENMRLKYTDMQTEEQGNEYTKRLHFLNPSLLNIQRPKTNSKACWNKSLFLSSSSYPSWVYSVTPRSMSTVTQSGIWSFMINSEQRKVVEMNWQRIFFFLQIFWILLCLLWYEQMLDSYAAVFKGNCKALCPSIIINFYNCMQYCTNKTKTG